MPSRVWKRRGTFFERRLRMLTRFSWLSALPAPPFSLHRLAGRHMGPGQFTLDNRFIKNKTRGESAATRADGLRERQCRRDSDFHAAMAVLRTGSLSQRDASGTGRATAQPACRLRRRYVGSLRT
jgi:hypothetical protein